MARLRSVKLSVRQKVMASMDYQRPVKRHWNIKKRPAHWVTARKEPPSLTAASLVTLPATFRRIKKRRQRRMEECPRDETSELIDRASRGDTVARQLLLSLHRASYG